MHFLRTLTVYFSIPFFNALTLIAQTDTNHTVAESYDFVNYQANVLEGPENSPTFNRFYNDFDRVFRYDFGQINIVHFGGSHIQADIWSNLIRERLQSFDTLDRGARGIVFPYRASGTNSPNSYSVKTTGKWEGHRSSYNKHKNTWGVMGITATTTDTLAAFKFTFKQSVVPVHFTRAILLTNQNSNDYSVNLKFDNPSQRESVYQTAEGYMQFGFSEPLDSIEIFFHKPKDSSDTLKFYGLILENDDPGVVYHTIGVNGSRFLSFQRCKLFEEQLAYLKPDLAIISIGTNDTSEPNYDSSTYRSNYEKFIQELRLVNPNCALILTVPNDSYIKSKQHNENLESARAAIQHLAAKYDARVWDLFAIMGGATSAKRWKEEGMMKSDLVHFTKEGYLLKGDLFYSAFREDYLRWFNGRVPIWSD